MEKTFKREWLKEIQSLPLKVPGGYDLNGFVNWERKYYFDDKNLISSYDARFGKVYDVGEDLAAKVFRNTPFIKGERIFNNQGEAAVTPYFLERGFEMTKELRKSGVSVPREKGLFLIYNKFLNEYKPAFVMEKIDYLEYENLKLNELKNINALRRKELDKAEKKNFIIGWDAEELRNALLSKKDGKVYLIDFMFWGIK